MNIGMKPNWVLSDEQCNIRFRKVRKDKSVNKANEMQREGTNSNEIEHVVKEEHPSVDQGIQFLWLQLLLDSHEKMRRNTDTVCGNYL